MQLTNKKNTDQEGFPKTMCRTNYLRTKKVHKERKCFVRATRARWQVSLKMTSSLSLTGIHTILKVVLIRHGNDSDSPETLPSSTFF